MFNDIYQVTVSVLLAVAAGAYLVKLIRTPFRLSKEAERLNLEKDKMGWKGPYHGRMVRFCTGNTTGEAARLRRHLAIPPSYAASFIGFEAAAPWLQLNSAVAAEAASGFPTGDEAFDARFRVAAAPGSEPRVLALLGSRVRALLRQMRGQVRIDEGLVMVFYVRDQALFREDLERARELAELLDETLRDKGTAASLMEMAHLDDEPAVAMKAAGFVLDGLPDDPGGVYRRALEETLDEWLQDGDAARRLWAAERREGAGSVAALCDVAESGAAATVHRRRALEMLAAKGVLAKGGLKADVIETLDMVIRTGGAPLAAAALEAANALGWSPAPKGLVERLPALDSRAKVEAVRTMRHAQPDREVREWLWTQLESKPTEALRQAIRTTLEAWGATSGALQLVEVDGAEEAAGGLAVAQGAEAGLSEVEAAGA